MIDRLGQFQYLESTKRSIINANGNENGKGIKKVMIIPTPYNINVPTINLLRDNNGVNDPDLFKYLINIFTLIIVLIGMIMLQNITNISQFNNADDG